MQVVFTPRLALLLSFFLLSFPALGADEMVLSAAQIKAIGVETRVLGAQTGKSVLVFPAEVIVPNGQLQVVSVPLAGLVETVNAVVNQPVRKGETLVRLQSPALVEAEREFLAAATRAGLAGRSLTRDAALFKDGIIAEGRYLNTRGAAAEAGAAYQQWKQTLALYGMSEAAIARLQKTGRLSASLDVVSPLDGVVIEQSVVAGQRAEASTPLYKVARLSPLWLEIQAAPTAVTGLSPGAEVFVPAAGARGKLLSIGRAVSAASQTVTLRAEISTGTENLRAGQYVEAHVAVPASTGAREWRVPVAALARSGGKSVLFVQTAKGFAAREVKVGGESADYVAIRGDFRGDERYAVKGVAALKAAWLGIGGE